MKPTLRSVVRQLAEEYGALRVLRAADAYGGYLSGAGPEALLARRSVSSVMASTGVALGDREDREEVLRELLGSLADKRLPRGISKQVGEALAKLMLLALAQKDELAETVASSLVWAFGKPILSLTWDGGGVPGSSGVETIVRVANSYYYNGDGGTLGPIASLKQATRDYVGLITSATVAIDSDELDTETLLRLFKLDEYIEPGHKVTINGQSFVVGSDLRLISEGKPGRRARPSQT